MDFHEICYFITFRKSVEIQILLKSDKNNRYTLFIYFII